MSRYTFHTTCVSSDSDSIQEMQACAGIGHQVGGSLSFNAVKSYLGDNFWKDFAHSASFFKNDPYVYCEQSSYQGFPCVYIKHSGIEHVYVLNENETLLPNGYFSSFEEFGESEIKERIKIISILGDQASEWSEALCELAARIGPAQQRTLKGDRFERTFTKIISDNTDIIGRVLQSYANMTGGFEDKIKNLRILPSSILTTERLVHNSVMDICCTIMDLVNVKGSHFGLTFPDPHMETATPSSHKPERVEISTTPSLRRS